MEHTENTILIRGELQQLPQFSHENHGKRFYRFALEVPRLSGAVDILPVIAEEHLLNAMDLSGGTMLQVRGQIRSHNLKTDGARRLLIFAFASEITTTDEPPANQVVLQGPLCRLPNLRRTPLGREICDVMLAVPRAFKRADYLPCILWGRTAQEVSACHTGNIVHIEGRFQSRVYNKVTDGTTQERTTYEISALSAEILDESL